MIIFLVLIMLLIALIGAFIYLNAKDYYTLNSVTQTLNSTNQDFFRTEAGYYKLYDSWKELTEQSSQDGETCFYNSNCVSGICMKNVDTNQSKCFETQDAGRKVGFSQESTETSPFNYGVSTLYTSICAQKKVQNVFESYYPDFKSKTLIDEIPTNFTNDCENYTFQQAPIGDAECYDVDQLAGIKIVEICQAPEDSNSICINNNGNRVYFPSLNELYIKPELKACEDNTSINYISFNYTNVPQTLPVFSDDKENFKNNQDFCLSIDSVTYYPDLTVRQTTVDNNNVYYLTFNGSWGYKYSYVISKTEEAKTVSNTGFTWFDVSINRQMSSVDSQNVNSRVSIDSAYGITYKIPKITITGNSYTIDDLPTVYYLGNMVDVTSISNQYAISSDISLKPCGIFNTSYQDTTGTVKLQDSIDKQKFKVSRFSMDSKAQDGFSPQQTGMVSSIVYRNLNYENGGLYLDYYVPGSTTDTTNPLFMPNTTEGLILRKVNNRDITTSYKWLLMPPVSLSPYTIPSGNNMWCNYCFDISNDGGYSFNGKNKVVVPMESNLIVPGTEIIDPAYKEIAKQPDNKLFNAIGDALEITGAIASAAAGNVISAGVKIYEVAKNPKNQFHWQNNDPSFGICSQLCTKKVTTIPVVKAVATSVGQLGSGPPGHSRGITQSFAEGDVLFGKTIGGTTCENYYLYDVDATVNKPISSRSIGDTYKDGNVNFVVRSVYDNTYMFSTNYFNNNTDVSVKTITASGKNYGLTDPPKDVINSVDVSSQILIYSFTTTSLSGQEPTCTLSNIDSGCKLDKSIDHTDLCTATTGILPQIVKKMNAKSWYIKRQSNEIPVTISFDSPCGNPNLGSQAFYVANSAKINIPVKTGTKTDSASVTITDDDLDKYFPLSTLSVDSEGNPNPTSTTVFTGDDEKLFDVNSEPLQLALTYGSFEREYRLYYKTSLVALVQLENLTTNGEVPPGDPLNVKILTITDVQTLHSNINSTFEVQEWWTMEGNFNGNIIIYEYHNSNASGCTVTLEDTVINWDVLESAPRNILSVDSNPIKFPASPNPPMSLLNNSVLKHGPSPQQIGYAGSFQEADAQCFKNKTETDCNNIDFCNWNTNTNICTGKTLIQYASEQYGDVFNLAQNFTGSLFNQKPDSSLFTNLTFIKTLQLKELNYQAYVPQPKQVIQGGSPTTYYEYPEFVNYSVQGIDNLGSNPPSLELGKFIPYQYFYTNYLDSNGNEQSMLQTNDANNFYVNMNYSQFIPYGKKEDYENGFAKTSDIPTF